MGLVNKEMKLMEIEKILSEELKGCTLVSDLNLALEEFEILGDKFKEYFSFAKDVNLLHQLVAKFSVSFSTFLVYWAIYNYNGEFWGTLENYFGAKHLRGISGDTFLMVTKRYKLKQFDDGGYKYVTPIVCHGGVPNCSLEDIFEIMYETISDQNFSPQYMLDELRYFLKYRIDRTVYRFITHNPEKAEELFQNIRDFMSAVENDEFTIDKCYLSFSYIDKRIIDTYFKWKSFKTQENRANKTRKYALVSPKLKIDAGGIGLYILFPKQTLKTGADDSISWVVEYDEENSIKDTCNCRLYYIGGSWLSEEKTFRVKLASGYTVSLYYEGEKISSWKYEGLSGDRPYLIFDNRDNLNKTDYIFNENITIVYNSSWKLQGDYISAVTMPSLLGEASKFKVLCLNFGTSSKGLYLEEQVSVKRLFIEYRRNNMITLKGGKFIFDEEPEIEDIPVYSGELPRLELEYPNDIVKEHLLREYKLLIKNKELNIWQDHILKDLPYELKQHHFRLNLNNIVSNYGEYEIRVIEGKNVRRIFALRYIPLISYINDVRGRWPNENKGYDRTYFMYRCEESVNIQFEETTNVIKALYRGKEYTKAFTDSVNQYLAGKLSFTLGGKEVSYPIKKMVRQLQWAWWTEDENNIKWEKKPSVLYINQLTTEVVPQLLLRLNLNREEFLDASITLSSPTGQVLQKKKMKIYNGKSIRISLDEFVTTILDTGFNRYTLNLSLYDKNCEKLCEFLVGILKEMVYIKNIEYKFAGADLIRISWEQEGSLEEKTIKVYNFSRPWKEGREIYLDTEKINSNRGRFSTELSKEEFGFTEPGVYIIKVEEDSFSFFEEDSYEVLLLESGKYIEFETDKIRDKGGDEKIKVEDYLSLILCSLNSANFKNIYSRLKSVGFYIDKQNVSKVLLCLYTISKNLIYVKTNSGEEGLKYVRAILSKVIENCLTEENKYSFLRELIKLNLSKKEFNMLVSLFNLYNLSVNKDWKLFNTEKQYLWNNHSDLGFIVEMRSLSRDKGVDINNICAYISEDSLEDMFEKQGSSTECSKKSISECISCISKGEENYSIEFKLSEELVGSVEEYQKIFMNKTQLLMGKKLDYVNWLGSYEDKGIRILGKSYVKTIYDWNENTSSEEKNKLKKLIEQYGEALIDDYNRLKNNSVLKAMGTMLSRRKDTNAINKSYYYIGITVLLKTMEAYGIVRLRNINEIDKLYQGFHRFNRELFLRDTVIMEMYLLSYRREG